MEQKNISFFWALFPILVLITLLGTNVYLYGDDSLGGANQLALLLTAALAGVIGIKNGGTFKSIMDGVSKSIASTTPAIIILLLIGSLAGTWLLSGIVPAMIYYGLQILNPTYFLVASCIICAIVSIATGSSWSTIATIGIALLGIGKALFITEEMSFSEEYQILGLIGGTIISGAYFGDKMSPLSDTTNLAPAMAGTDLFTHIRYMMYTTIPSYLITLIIFLIIGFKLDPNSNSNIQELLIAIEGSFNISPWLFLVPLAVILMIIKKIPALPALLVGTLLGGVFAVIFQPQIITQISGISDNFYQASYVAIINAMGGDISITTSNEMINDLLSTGGMYGMLNTIWLILCAMMFGGVMESTGLLHRISASIIQYAESTGSVIATTACTCLFFNVTASDQYLSIVVPGRMYADTFREKGLAPENLSRTLEDSGTVTSVLIPWNTCGATQSAVLGVATFAYLPFCFFNIISPFMTVLYGYLGIKIRKING